MHLHHLNLFSSLSRKKGKSHTHIYVDSLLTIIFILSNTTDCHTATLTLAITLTTNFNLKLKNKSTLKQPFDVVRTSKNVLTLLMKSVFWSS